MGWTPLYMQVLVLTKKSITSYLHIVSYACILVNDCSFDVSVLPNTNRNTTFCSKKLPVSISLEHKNNKKWTFMMLVIFYFSHSMIHRKVLIEGIHFPSYLNWQKNIKAFKGTVKHYRDVLPHNNLLPSAMNLQWLHLQLCKIEVQQQNDEFCSSAQSRLKERYQFITGISV